MTGGRGEEGKENEEEGGGIEGWENINPDGISRARAIAIARGIVSEAGQCACSFESGWEIAAG